MTRVVSLRRIWRPPIFSALLFVCWNHHGCSSSAFNAGTPGADDDASVGNRSDSGMPDGAGAGLRVVESSFGPRAGNSNASSLRIHNDGFEAKNRVCAQTVCVTGALEP
jgi:hypothetical protein